MNGSANGSSGNNNINNSNNAGGASGTHKKRNQLAKKFKHQGKSYSVDWTASTNGVDSSTRELVSPLPNSLRRSTQHTTSTHRGSAGEFFSAVAEGEEAAANKRDSLQQQQSKDNDPSESRWESFFQAIRPILSRSSVTSPTSASASSAIETQQQQQQQQQQHSAGSKVGDSSTTTTAAHSLKPRHLQRRATIDASIFPFRRVRSPTDQSIRLDTFKSPHAKTPLVSPTSDEISMSANSSIDEEAAMPRTITEESQEMSPKKSWTAKIRRRRSSLQLPSNTSSREHFFGVRERWREAIHRIRDFTLPHSLFRRKTMSARTRVEQSALPLMSSAMAVPFYAFSRDEHHHKGVPVIFDAVQVGDVHAS